MFHKNILCIVLGCLVFTMSNVERVNAQVPQNNLLSSHNLLKCGRKTAFIGLGAGVGLFTTLLILVLVCGRNESDKLSYNNMFLALLAAPLSAIACEKILNILWDIDNPRLVRGEKMLIAAEQVVALVYSELENKTTLEYCKKQEFINLLTSAESFIELVLKDNPSSMLLAKGDFLKKQIEEIIHNLNANLLTEGRNNVA